MTRPQHGEYRVGYGFYDSSLNGWIKDPAKLSDVIPGRPAGESEREQVAGWGRRTFKPNHELEQMLRLRDSDRPEDRAAYQSLAQGGRRIQVYDYEAKRSEAVASGEWKPES